MTIAYQSAGALNFSSNACSPGVPASMTDGDGMFSVIVTKPGTNVVSLPNSQTTVGQNVGGAGTTGAGVGPTRVGLFFREKTSTWSTGSTYTCVGGSGTAGMSFRFTKDPGKVWEFDNRNGTYNSVAVGLSLNNTTSAIDLQVGDWVLTAISNRNEIANWSAQSYTASGITFSAITLFSDAIETTTGNDVGGAFWGAQVTAGSGFVTVQQQATASSNASGAVVFCRLRESFSGWGVAV